MIRRIGAWVDRRGLLHPEKWLNVARGCGLTDVSLTLHAQDAGESLQPFERVGTVAKIVKGYRDAGIAPHVMLWPQPRSTHADQLLDYLGELHERCEGALASAELDAEEQWTRSAWRALRGNAVAQQIRAGWPKGLPLVVNGITAALPKILPLVKVADVLIPQAYTSTRMGQGSTPGKRQDVVADAWRKELRPGAVLAMGLAAYSQEGAGGLSAESALKVAFDACVDECERIQYWSLADMTDGTAARKFIGARCKELSR